MTNARARTRTLRGVGATPCAFIALPSSSETRPPCSDDAARTYAGHERRAIGERGGNRRDQHRLLGVGGTAHAAVTQVPAADDVAADRRRGNADALGTARQRFVVGVGSDFPGSDGKARFHLREPRGHVVHRESAQSEFALPPGERGRRRAKGAGPVDGRAAAHAATLQDVDRLVACLARGGFLIQVRIGFRFTHPEIGGPLEGPLLQHDHLEPGLGENFRRCAAAGTAADDRDVGIERDVLRERRRIDDVPTRRQARIERVGDSGIARGRHAASSGGPG